MGSIEMSAKHKLDSGVQDRSAGMGDVIDTAVVGNQKKGAGAV